MTGTGIPVEIRDFVANFEQRRLDLMAEEGFACDSVRLPGPEGHTYLLVGGEGAPTRLLIHGGLGDASVWGPLAARLDGRVVVADRPGHGLSFPVDYRQKGSFRAAAASWVRDVVEGLGEGPVDLVANSMGGYFAIAFASAHPDLVRRLVLVGCPAGLEFVVPPMWFRLWGNPITGQVIRRMGIKSLDQFQAAVIPGLVAHPERVTRDQAAIQFAAGHQPGFAIAAHTMFRALTTLRGWRDDQLLDAAIRALDVPTLFVWGDHDQYAPPTRGAEIAGSMADARFELIGDAGHVPWADQPDEVAGVINGYLNPS